MLLIVRQKRLLLGEKLSSSTFRMKNTILAGSKHRSLNKISLKIENRNNMHTFYENPNHMYF